jgi:DUF438 domain-containing protein
MAANEQKKPEILLPSDVRSIILDEHNQLRKLLSGLEGLLPNHDVKQLKQALAALEKDFKAHLAREEALVWPILATIDSWGPLRQAKMAQEHQDQARQIEGLADVLHKESTAERQKILIDFIAAIRADMIEEEAEFLNAEILRDDAITIRHFGG